MNRRRTIAAVLIAVCLVFISLDFRDQGGPLGAFQRQFSGFFEPALRLTSTVTAPIGGFFSNITDIGRLRQRIEDLEADNAQLRDQTANVSDLRAQNDELRGLLNMAARQNLSLVGARVIAHRPGDTDRQVMIDRGFNAGIGIGMAVMDTDGVVGVVDTVGSDYATVDLISSDQTNLVVRIAENRVRGTLVGQGADLLAMTVIDSNAAVPANAEVVTQVYTGSAIPDGLPVGRLESNESTTASNVEEVRFVRPFSNVGQISQVAVVIAGNTPTTDLAGLEVLDPNAVPVPDFEAKASETPAVKRPEQVVPTLQEARRSGPDEPDDVDVTTDDERGE
ncbi:rod shape-determining protein MreC [Stomatohabitans albus]|uniref:rod shape-determining protein MreC n=1 Tax=Stomatohabitans albus TaxID=3110766 RepID=UPI00300C013A